MNFKNVNNIYIPEGNVIKITDSNGVVIWKNYESFPELPNYPILPEPTASRIYYYSTDERAVSISNDYVISSTYEDGIGVVKFNIGLISIPSYVFMDKKITYARLPDGVNTISSGAFAGSSLQFIDIPDSVEYINTQAFAECSGLKTVILPKNINTIGNEVFYLCSTLTTIICQSKTAPIIRPHTGDLKLATFEGVAASIPSETPKYLYVPKGSTGYDEGEWKKQLLDKGWTLVYYKGEKPDYPDTPVFPDELKATFLYTTTDNNVIKFNSNYSGINYLSNTYKDGVGEMVFKDKNRISKMGNRMFQQCITLQNIIIPDSVTLIGDNVFVECTSLTSVIIPDSVTSIGATVFQSCSSLQSVVIPDSVTSIGSGVFQNCSSLTLIEIPSSVTFINQYTFYGCSSLTSITIPNSVTSIGEYAFKNCTSLQYINCKAIQAPTIWSSTFGNVGKNVQGEKILYVPQGSSGYETWLEQLEGFELQYITE